MVKLIWETDSQIKDMNITTPVSCVADCRTTIKHFIIRLSMSDSTPGISTRIDLQYLIG